MPTSCPTLSYDFPYVVLKKKAFENSKNTEEPKKLQRKMSIRFDRRDEGPPAP